MKALVVYYSLEGNCKFIAEEIKKETGADILELKPVNDISKKGFFRYFSGGYQALREKKPELKPVNIDLSQYDIIFLGAPVWAQRFAPTINTFISGNQFSGKKIALFCTSGSGNTKALGKMKEQLEKENTIIGELEFANPLKKNKEESLKKLGEWLGNILK